MGVSLPALLLLISLVLFPFLCVCVYVCELRKPPSKREEMESSRCDDAFTSGEAKQLHIRPSPSIHTKLMA